MVISFQDQDKVSVFGHSGLVNSQRNSRQFYLACVFKHTRTNTHTQTNRDEYSIVPVDKRQTRECFSRKKHSCGSFYQN